MLQVETVNDNKPTNTPQGESGISPQLIKQAAHELLSPLSSIHNVLEMLAGENLGPLTDSQREFLRMGLDRSDYLVSVIDRLIYVSQIMSGTLTLTIMPLDLAYLVQSVAEEFQPIAEDHSLALEADIQEERCLVEGDNQRIRWMLSRLLDNAIRYSPSGGKIILKLVCAADTAVINVKDTGIGISDADLPHVFEPFFRSEDRTVQEIKGLGLGLYISQAIVDLHSGTIQVGSQQGQGTTVTVRLPLEIPG